MFYALTGDAGCSAHQSVRFAAITFLVGVAGTANCRYIAKELANDWNCTIAADYSAIVVPVDIASATRWLRRFLSSDGCGSQSDNDRNELHAEYSGSQLRGLADLGKTGSQDIVAREGRQRCQVCRE